MDLAAEGSKDVSIEIEATVDPDKNFIIQSIREIEPEVAPEQEEPIVAGNNKPTELAEEAIPDVLPGPGPLMFVQNPITVRELRTFRDALAVLPMPVVRLLVAAQSRIEGLPVFSMGQDADVDGTSYNVTTDNGAIRLTITTGTRDQAVANGKIAQLEKDIARVTKIARAKEVDLTEQRRVEKEAKRDLGLGPVEDTIADLWKTADAYQKQIDDLRPATETYSRILLFTDFGGAPYVLPFEAHYLIEGEIETGDADEDDE